VPKNGKSLGFFGLSEGRSEPVTLQGDVIAAELSAAKERRTLSSFIEGAVEKAVQEVVVTKAQNGELLTAHQVTKDVWSEIELERITAIAGAYPELLTSRDRELLRAAGPSPDRPLAEAVKTLFDDEFETRISTARRNGSITEEDAQRALERLREAREHTRLKLEELTHLLIEKQILEREEKR
jgi:hypothetical protein